jgi:hypothetical protein
MVISLLLTLTLAYITIKLYKQHQRFKLVPKPFPQIPLIGGTIGNSVLVIKKKEYELSDLQLKFGPVMLAGPFGMPMLWVSDPAEIKRIHNDNLSHYDISNAFMNSTLEEEVHITLPNGYISPKGLKCARLLRGLNGLKQGSRNWNKNNDSAIKRIGFTQSKKDNCVYFTKDALMVIIVDDMLLMTSNDVTKKKFEEMLDNCYKHRKIGVPKVFNGTQYKYGVNGEIFTHQENYITKKLE